MASPRNLTDPRVLGAQVLPALALSGWVLLAWLSRHPPDGLVWWLLSLLAIQWTLALVMGLRASPKSRRRWMGWGIAFRAVGFFAWPILDDDYYRFLWDGRIFALTGNPYGTAPNASFQDAAVPPRFQTILDHVNYPDVPTIYGPVCQLGFLFSYLVAPAALWPWKLLLLGADIGLLTLLPRLGERDIGARAARFAAFCPLSIFETAFNAHPDAIGVALMTAALVARQSGSKVSLGLWCGAAVGAKLFALLAVPFLLWRRWRAWAGFSAVVVACYLPFWWQGSVAEVAGLQVFVRDWEFNSSGYALLAWGLPPPWARLLATLLFGAAWTALFCIWVQRAEHLRALLPGFLLFGLFFLLSPTFNPWYALWLLPFVAMRPTPTGVAALAAVSLSYLTRQNLGSGALDGFAHPAWVRPVEFGIIAFTLLAEISRRRRVKSMKLIEQTHDIA